MEMIVSDKQNTKANQVTFDQRAEELKDQDEREKKAQERKKKSPYNNFAQMNLDHSKEIRALIKQNANAYMIFTFIVEHMDRYNALACSNKVFQEALGLSRTTVYRAIDTLKTSGFVYISKLGTTNVYLANDDLVWKSWAKNRDYCDFPANIILAKSEQETAKTKENKIKTLEIKEK